MFNKKTTFGGEMRDVASKSFAYDDEIIAQPRMRRSIESLDFDTLSQEELSNLVSELSSRITNKRLADRNLEYEFETQLMHAKRLQEELVDLEAEPKEKIAALNAVTSVLRELTKLREGLQTIEDLRRVEAALLETIEDMPEAARGKFLDKYEAIYKRMSD